jgi:NDP-sugar pyrophosphorylase family protein
MRQAVILAGGRATRMRPHSIDRPKAMIEVAGTPILGHQLEWLARNDVSSVVVSVGYRAEVIQEHLGDGSRYGVRVDYAVEDEPRGRGGGLKLGARSLPHPAESWLGLNGDVLCRFPISELAARHRDLVRRLAVAATVALAPYRSNWGVAELDDDLIRRFVQGPRLPYWINAGIYAFEPEMVDALPEVGDHEESTLPELAEEGRLGSFLVRGYWRGIDTIKDVAEAAAELSRL